MGDYSDYRVNQGRLERAQERAKRQKRNAILVGGVLAAVVVVFGLAASVRHAPVAAQVPRLVLTWPSPNKYGKRTFRNSPNDYGIISAGEVLARPNQPFTAALADPAQWDATVVTAAGSGPGADTTWRAGKDETLKFFARPATSGWRQLFAWMAPRTELRLTARQAAVVDANRRTLQVKVHNPSVWLSANVAAGNSADAESSLPWDERAIPLLEAAGRAVPYSGPKPGPGRSMPLPPPAAPRWELVDGFGEKRAPGDNGSYFNLDAAEALSDDAPIIMTKLARQIAARAPKTSIKWIVSDSGSSDARATIRLEFDDSGARGGWVKRSHETQAAPLRWWNTNLGETDIRNRLSPSLPR